MAIIRIIVIYSCMVIFLSESRAENPAATPTAEILDWQSYKTEFGKIYANSVSEKEHKKNFIRNVQEIKAHNAKFEEGKVTYILGLNEFSDQDPETFSSKMNGYIKSNETIADEITSTTLRPINSLGASFDWREQNKVSPVKNQGQCGSCWAFSALGALESQLLIKGKGSTTLSEQQLVDCFKKSCKGGDYPPAWKYIQSKGIQSDADYPYTSKNGAAGRCKYDQSKIVTRLSGIQRVPNNAEQIKSTLQSVGPLSVAVDGKKLQQYRQGIFKCSSPKLSHAVLLVGYGSENGKDYWIVKNSWGNRWGEKGFVRISRDPGSDCGVTKDVAYATL